MWTSGRRINRGHEIRESSGRLAITSNPITINHLEKAGKNTDVQTVFNLTDSGD
jgi:hypothetical protein